MKVKPRPTKKRISAKRITAPETRIDPESQKKIVQLSFIDAGSYQKHAPTTKELFLYSAGTTEIGEVSDGLDRLSHHSYTVHLNERGKAIGLDIVPSRLYRSGVVPTSMEGVKTLTIQYDLDGAVARVVSRPFNLRASLAHEIIRELDKIIQTGKAITTTVRIGGLGRVVNTTENSVEIKINASRSQTQNPASAVVDMDDVHEAPDAPAAPPTVPAS